MIKCERCGRDIYNDVVQKFGLDNDYKAYENNKPFEIKTETEETELILELGQGKAVYKIKPTYSKNQYTCPFCGGYPFKTLVEFIMVDTQDDWRSYDDWEE